MAKPTLPLISSIAIFLMLLNLATSQDSLSFSFNNFEQEATRNLIFQGNAHIEPKAQFSFFLKSRNSDHPADGLAFFIAPADTTIPPGSNGGLFELDKALNASANEVVAIEFDTFYNRSSNEWDPGWDRRDGETLNVLVTYTASTRTLAVVASYPDAKKYELSYEVDLAQVLPEYVRVGFSASTGYQFQFHTLQSWSFTSVLVNTGNKKNENIVLPREM
ncbi:hypothetical protein PIB30_001928 [Stylosanthes scabra]|uniref:Legume lectin domain-containing protein n=1 Tax=Stylosanthes scabra TaxID=79078 RepID=A0ABU6Y3B0_9FABA|nr:hypothetical protein [Stylosanthes scabra]